MILFGKIYTWPKAQFNLLSNYYARLLELNNVAKSRVVCSILFFFHLFFIILLYTQQHHPIINSAALPWAFSLQILCILLSSILYLLSYFLKSNPKNDFYFPIICLGLYSSSLMSIGIFAGMMTILTGVFTIGSIFTGLLIFSGRIIFWGSVPCFIVFYVTSILNLFHILPYAYLFPVGTFVPAQSQSLMITINLVITTIVGIVISQVFVSFLDRWSIRDQNQRHLMSIDPLTQILNRRGLEQALYQLRQNHPNQTTTIAYTLLDIDFFKHINDQYGHDVGDQVLQSIPQILRNHLRDTDIIGRHGGEEFLLIITNTDFTDVKQILERCRQAIEDYDLYDNGKQIKFTASFGVCFYSDLHTNTQQLFKIADQALYQAKHLGRNQIQVFIETNTV